MSSQTEGEGEKGRGEEKGGNGKGRDLYLTKHKYGTLLLRLLQQEPLVQEWKPLLPSPDPRCAPDTQIRILRREAIRGERRRKERVEERNISVPVVHLNFGQR